MVKVLTLGKGKNKREWELSNEEFKRFELMFEECELVELPDDFDVSQMKITLVEPPKRTI